MQCNTRSLGATAFLPSSEAPSVVQKTLELTDLSPEERRGLMSDVLHFRTKLPHAVEYTRVFGTGERHQLRLERLYVPRKVYLDAELDKLCRIPEERFWNLLAQITEFLEYLHAPTYRGSTKRVQMHLGLHAENLFFTDEWQLLVDGVGMERLYARWCKQYLPPDEDLTPKADIFLLGLTIYALCQGQVSFQSIPLNSISPLTIAETLRWYGYSALLVSVLSDCLTLDYRHRPTASLLHSRYLRYPMDLRAAWILHQPTLEPVKGLTQSATGSFRQSQKMIAVAIRDLDALREATAVSGQYDIISGRTALMLAAELCFTEAIPYLYDEAGIVLTRYEETPSDRTILLSSTFSLRQVHITSESKVPGDAEASEAKTYTALTLALENRSRGAVALLAPHESGLAGFTRLMEAAVMGDPVLLCRYGHQRRQRCCGLTALMLAAWFGNLQCVELLLDEVDILDEKNRTALSYANMCPSASCVQLIATHWLHHMGGSPLMYYVQVDVPFTLDNVADALRRDQIGMNALAHAIHLENHKALERLLQHVPPSDELLNLAITVESPSIVELICRVAESHAILLTLQGRKGDEVLIETALMKAAALGEPEKVRCHISQVNCITCGSMVVVYDQCLILVSEAHPPYSCTALMYAVNSNSPACVQLLRAEMGIQNNWGQTALMLAAQNGLSDCARLLLAEQGIHDKKSRTALMLAAERGHLGCVRLLAREMGELDDTGLTALIYAANNGHTEVARELAMEIGQGEMTHLMFAALLRDRSSLEAHLPQEMGKKNVAGWTALMYAARVGYSEGVELLLGERGAKNRDGSTALLLALMHGHRGAIRLLVDEIGFGGVTRGMCLAALGDTDQLQQDLKDTKISIPALSSNGYSALMYAAIANSIACIPLLTNELLAIDNSGETALMHAVRHHNTECVKALLNERGVTNRQGMTALMIAAQLGHADCVELLMSEAGRQTNDGWSALMFAAHMGHPSCVMLLCDKEGDLKTRLGSNALQIATTNGHIECARLLAEREGGE
ncbi:Kinase, NEK [Giardia muris]|uniref:Kinase, NEK n=1 Tax=Giardia muris TaxID=5742 RepID=A0A4Z1T4P2_GIAMU|nr:Kinase, NEK [Giardia muris]|eukprot:TNJ28047.1 Kinase, NEK [Giardia muris]